MSLTIRSLASVGFFECVATGAYITWWTSAFLRRGFPFVASRHISALLRVHRPIPVKLSKLSCGRKLACLPVVRRLVLTQTNAQVLNWNPHASMTSRASLIFGNVAHINRVQLGVAIFAMGRALMSETAMVL